MYMILRKKPGSQVNEQQFRKTVTPTHNVGDSHNPKDTFFTTEDTEGREKQIFFLFSVLSVSSVVESTSPVFYDKIATVRH